MGTLAKRLGQLAAKGVETEASNILKTSAANKIPGSLAQLLDGTLREGHDMKVFGLGTAASMANRDRYGRFTASMQAVYSAMEAEFDACSPAAAPAVHAVWVRHGDQLRRCPLLTADLADVGVAPGGAASAATAAYVEAIHAAGSADRAGGGGRLLGHLYCRYFADLFGGQVLGAPTRAALALPEATPRHYRFDFREDTRRELIEAVYTSLNEAGGSIGPDQVAAATDEALMAFKLNADVYSEEPIYVDAAKGIANVIAGFTMRPSQLLGFLRGLKQNQK